MNDQESISDAPSGAVREPKATGAEEGRPLTIEDAPMRLSGPERRAFLGGAITYRARGSLDQNPYEDAGCRLAWAEGWDAQEAQGPLVGGAGSPAGGTT